MRVFLLIIISISFSLAVSAQQERDTVLKRCPIFITDTVSSNNFFIEGQPATLKVDRIKGDLTIIVQQRDQYFTIFVRDKKLKNTKYKIQVGAKGKNTIEAKYSFRAGEQVSYVNVRSGTMECAFDKEKDMWHLKVNGLIANLVERTVTYYRVKAELFLK